MATSKQFRAAWTFDDRRTILVAEDDPEMRRVLVDTLRDEGYVVDAVANGAALIIELTRRGPLQRPRVDLVISDVRMPGCSGLAAVETVRRLYGEVPVLFLTAFPDDAMHARARELDAVILDKPVTMRAFRGIVAGLLAKSAHP